MRLQNKIGIVTAAGSGMDWKDFDLAVDLNLRSQIVTTDAALPVDGGTTA